MSENILFDLEGLIKERFKSSTKLGLEQTGQRVSAPAAELSVPATMPKVTPEATPRLQQTEPTKAQPQSTLSNKNNMRVDYSPLKSTVNFERFIQ